MKAITNTLKTESVITSWMILSCTVEYVPLPQRLAGTIIIYSKNAMPQLAKIATHNGVLLNFKCPYHANVIKTFEPVNSTIGNHADCRGSTLIHTPEKGTGSYTFARKP